MIPKPEVTWQPTTVRVDDHLHDRGYKLRDENYEQVLRYALEMENGASFPPIKIANVRGKMHVVDGYHRLAAARYIGRETIKAVVAKMSASVARAWAIDANASNGLPLTSADRKPIFAMYMKAKLHLREDGRIKPRRTIADELSSSLGQRLSANTVKVWMEEYWAKAFKRDPDRPINRDTRFDDEATHDGDKIDAVNTALTHIKRLYWEVEEAASRERIKQMLAFMADGIDTPISTIDDDDCEIDDTLDV
ncbi:ParB/RepB/Spo0J family partition protein [Sphingosinicellaceae bacterium]|nr:ParB/RepB/Spo0J family partition protein [Sphingosinicellaceae bacterium]